MNLWLFDSLSKTRKDLFTEENISIYLCGPTLYNYLHIGNLRPIIVFDFLIRYLRIVKKPYKYIQNLTDIDEKILLKAHYENKSLEEIVEKYKDSFFNILQKLNIILPDNLPTVSSNMENIQLCISSLIGQKKAFWDKKTQTIKFLNSKKEKDLNYFSGNAVSEEDSSFALWKENNLTSKSYKSPWFPGIPGWHIECFSIIRESFSEIPITIHGGGVDLKFPHHENENLISRFWFKKDIAKIWIHIGQVLNEEGKLSKSSNYSLKVEDCAEQYSWNFLRYLFMKVSYHKPFTLNKTVLNDFWLEWNSFITTLNYAEIILLKAEYFTIFSFYSKGNKKEELPDEIIIKHLENDLNLPELLSWLEELKKTLLNLIKSSSDYENIYFYWKKLKNSLEFLGFKIKKLDEENIKEAKKWFQLVDQKNYEEADKLRLKLIEKNILP